uniref:L-ascorbate peroxidase n=1 Tax=Tetraselmis sp. GSL018 TaxID=582737 RepID=A0A061RD54_9CHLO|mmetsp:Transcript_19236/g.45868  ORF Transcript_19236/g.45868 Transcript_19236/m.45868 type:complete len:358 (-) Transcript_19236:127-1200(-)|eukprot:CAMPEP_0177592740 /NCGR_PEP_ID=MMETSP0419_2-20121207/8727_1 /TAXON_ID=582737 /ORGANISM="Tetraselmis sp., Strain GSL018" /LENGTH=357 /DNA_ID=CAMNT_0019083639 /DNA_START=169 /DNA_END=1242 /DNA_ORIENTATION=+
MLSVSNSFSAGSRLCQRPVSATSRKLAAVVASSNPKEIRSGALETRRQFLLAGGAAALVPLTWTGSSLAAGGFKKTLNIDQLSSFQRKAMFSEMTSRAIEVLKEKLSSEDAAACMRLVLLDAGSYDIRSKTGGMNGSVILSGELPAGEKQSLAATIDKLKAAKEEIDARTEKTGTGQANISWADLLALAGKVTTQQSWRESKINRAETAQGGQTIADYFGTPFEVKIGRIDSSDADAGLSVPGPDAPIEEVKAWMNTLGNKEPDAKPGPFSSKPPFGPRPGYLLWTAGQLDPAAAEEYLAQDKEFAGWKKKYDQSKRTVTRTDFEVDFIENYNKLTSYAKFDAEAYCYPLTIEVKNL